MKAILCPTVSCCGICELKWFPAKTKPTVMNSCVQMSASWRRSFFCAHANPLYSDNNNNKSNDTAGTKERTKAGTWTHRETGLDSASHPVERTDCKARGRRRRFGKAATRVSLNHFNTKQWDYVNVIPRGRIFISFFFLSFVSPVFWHSNKAY